MPVGRSKRSLQSPTLLILLAIVLLWIHFPSSPSLIDTVFTFHEAFPIFSELPGFIFEPIPGYESLSAFPSQVLSNCSLCSFTVRNARPNSSPRDVIVAGMFDHIVNVVPFIRTLRTTGSRATVILFVDSNAGSKVDPSLTSFFNACAITVLYVKHRHISARHSKQMRHMLFADFFRTRYYLFDRILTVDLFDTVFQGDPFFEGFNRDAITFNCHIDRPFGRHLDSIMSLIDPSNQKLREEIAEVGYINSGMCTGGIEPQLRFWKCYWHILLARNQSVLESLVYPDQDIVNAVVRSNAAARAGIPIGRYGEGDYFHLAVKNWAKAGVVNEIGQYRMPGAELYPLVIHQADRSPILTASIVRACPQEFPQAEVYLRGLVNR
jgi:hypothetical protein